MIERSSFETILAPWDDAYAMARDMRVPASRARQWVSRGFVPVWYWPDLIEVLKQKHGKRVTYADLVHATIAERGKGILSGAKRGAETKRRRRDETSEAA